MFTFYVVFLQVVERVTASIVSHLHLQFIVRQKEVSMMSWSKCDHNFS